MKTIEIKSYTNGSYSYYSENLKRHINIPSELAKAILELQKQKADLLQALSLLYDEQTKDVWVEVKPVLRKHHQRLIIDAIQKSTT